MKAAVRFQSLLQRFFTERLIQQRQASPHTIGSYRDTFKLLLQFAHKRLHTTPDHIKFEQINAPLIGAFLNDLEKNRGIGARTRNLRLTAIRSFFRYASFETPAHAAQIQRVLAIPSKRYNRTLVHYLTRSEVDALLATPDKYTWTGRRDHALLLLGVQTGLRLSEITGLKRQDVSLGTGAHVRVLGKGRKARSTPLSKHTTAVLKAWLQEPARNNTDVLFPNIRGGRLSSDAVQRLLGKHVTIARTSCPTLREKRVSPHVLRHAAAMELLRAGVDQAVIALWLGHESIETTQIYLDADLELKEKILAKTTSPRSTPGRYRPDNQLLAFLKSL